ncbi:GlxA family transcriptional regulator [Paraburkholderia bannensis]|uniref:GlxA family transcriptional regulator n=1 Tax=Paraburkholderia bannensis TaxID=765414 RepID=UPI002AC32A3A|nr:GlxA family transcriptional regulator [Paraburkholderia bannensis]
MPHPLPSDHHKVSEPISFGIVLLPNFTLTAFSGFVDLLRLASDEGDLSRPVRCSWTIVAESLAPIRASCGIQVNPWESFDDAGTFDYLLVIGGLLHSGPSAGEATLHFIRTAAASGVTLVGICTGAFALAHAGVMDGYRICVSWFHYWDFVERFPNIAESHLIADRLFVIDRGRITCSGGRASIDVAAAILLRHLDAAIVQKAQRILIVDDVQRGNTPQPYPPGSSPAAHPKVRRAILIMELHIANPLPLAELARRVDTSVRQIERLFVTETGKSPKVYSRQIRVRMAAWMLTGSDRTVADIAVSCGFSDSSHLGREFRKEFGSSPSAYRLACLHIEEAAV